MITLIVVIFYIGGFVAAVEAVMTTRTAQGAIAWSVSLVSFPFVALPAYMIFGRSKFEGTAAAYEQSKHEIDALVVQFRQHMQPWFVPKDESPSVYHAVRRLAKMELTHGNKAELLINGDATFGSILKGIASARDYVLF